MPDRGFDSTAAVQALAITLVAIVLVPPGSHLFSLISKMRLAPEHYMVAQRAYDAWALFGIAIIAALLVTLWHGYLMRGNNTAVRLSLVSFLCLVGTQVIFWIYTHPMNVATANWTAMPDQFEGVRRQWEYSHAAGAVLAFAALVAIIVAVLADSRGAVSDACR